MADFPHIGKWVGSYWYWRHGYDNLDPFERPIPAPVAGIFDNTGGDLRTVCFNPAWSPVLTGALSRLTVEELYLSGGENAVQEVQNFINIIAGIGDNPCLPQSIGSTECAYYPSWYAGIEYIPYNPFSGGDLPDNYNVAPFFKFSRIDTIFPDWIDDFFHGAIENTTGYLENDVFVSFFSLPTYQNPFDGLDYPTIKLTVQGSGILRLKLLLVPFGGRALISFNPVGVFDVLNAIWSTEDRIVELNRDILSLVPETDLDAIEEIVLDEDKTHEIYITYLPTINDEAPVFQFGGGFRGYELCGNLTVISPITGEPIDFNNPDGNNIFQEGIAMGTYEDFLDALDAHEKRKASRYLLAQEGNVSDGVTLDASIAGDGGGAGIGGVQLSAGLGSLITPDVDASSEEARNGGVYRQALGIANLLSEHQSLKTSGFSASQIVNVSKIVINPLDLTAWTSIITDYFASSDNIVINVDALTEHLYCNSIGVGVVQYATEIVNSNPRHTATETDFLVRFIGEIPSTTFNDWYAEGINQPRDGFTSYPCYFLDAQEMEFDASLMGVRGDVEAYIFTAQSNRVKRVEISGKITDAEGREFDGFHFRDTDGSITYNKMNLRGNTNVNYDHTNTPVFKVNGGYAVDFEVVGNVYITNVFVAFNALQNAWFSDFVNPTGTISVKLIDIGVI